MFFFNFLIFFIGIVHSAKVLLKSRNRL